MCTTYNNTTCNMVPVSSDTTAVISWAFSKVQLLVRISILNKIECFLYLHENVMSTVGVARSRKQRHWGRLRPAWSWCMQTIFGEHLHFITKLSAGNNSFHFMLACKIIWKRMLFILCHHFINQPKEAALYQYTHHCTTTHYKWTTAPTSPSQSLKGLVLSW